MKRNNLSQNVKIQNLLKRKNNEVFSMGLKNRIENNTKYDEAYDVIPVNIHTLKLKKKQKEKKKNNRRYSETL